MVTYGKENGQGIGFMQIRKSIENMNGKLEICSRLGSGSEFIIEFPLV